MLETIITSSIIGACSFWFLKFCAPKLLKWRELKDEITTTTTEFGHFYSVPVEGDQLLTTKPLYDKVQQKLRRMAGELTTLSNIPVFQLWVKLGLLPSNHIIEKTKGALIGWSNSLVKTDWHSLHRELFIEEAKKHLGLPNSYKELRDIQRLESKNTGNNSSQRV